MTAPGGRVPRDDDWCDWCADLIQAAPFRFDGRVFCSPKCVHAYRRGSDSPTVTQLREPK